MKSYDSLKGQFSVAKFRKCRFPKNSDFFFGKIHDYNFMEIFDFWDYYIVVNIFQLSNSGFFKSDGGEEVFDNIIDSFHVVLVR